MISLILLTSLLEAAYGGLVELQKKKKRKKMRKDKSVATCMTDTLPNVVNEI